MKKNLSWNKSRLAVMLAFITNGVLMATWVSRIPTVQVRLALSDSKLGLVLAGLSAGLLTALLMTGGLIARFGSPKVTLASTLASCLALPLLGIITRPLLLFAALFVFGGGISAADVAMNEQAVFVERKAARPIMSSFHGGYSLGGLAGALIGAGMASIPSLTLLAHFIAIAIAVCGVIAFVLPHLIPSEIETGIKSTVFRFPERVIWMFGVIAFCSSIAEETVADWGGVFLTQVLNTNLSFAALGFAAFSLMMTTMRMTGDFLVKKWSPATVIRAGGLTAALGILAISFTNNPFVVIAGLAAVGVGVANIVPSLFSAAGNIPGISPGTAIAGVATIGYSGFLVGPPMIGFIAEAASLRTALLVSAIIVGTMAFSGKAISSKRKTQ